MQVRLEGKWGCCISGEHFRSLRAYFSATVIYCATYGWRRGEVEFGPCEPGPTPSRRSPTVKAALPAGLGSAECRQPSFLGCLHLDQAQEIFLGFFLSFGLAIFFPAVFKKDVSQQVGLQKCICNKNYIKKITGISINFGVCDPEINLTLSVLWKGVAHGLCPL